MSGNEKLAIMAVVASFAAPNALLAQDAVPHPSVLAISRALSAWQGAQRSSGMLGARSLSQKCRAQAEASESWAMADRCIAIDTFASALDDGMHELLNRPANPYFTESSSVARWRAMVAVLRGTEGAKADHVFAVQHQAYNMWVELGPTRALGLPR
jgi:hypothetical protein